MQLRGLALATVQADVILIPSFAAVTSERHAS